MCQAAAGAARQQAEDQAGLLRRAAIMFRVDAEGAVPAVQARRLRLGRGEARIPHQRAVGEDPVGLRRGLAGSRLVEMDQGAADFAGAGEEVEQLVALAPADGALQVEEVLLEALQHLEHGLAIVHEHVAPHRGIGGGDAREVAEAAGGDTSAPRC